MQEITNYLNFDGNCGEAMKFYSKCLDGELFMMPFSQFPEQCGEMPKEAGERVMHARLTKGSAVIMASDTPPGMPLHQGNNFSLSITCDSVEEADRLFAALGENGKVVMPMQDMFWGDYWGMCTDQFGINWMFSYQKTPHVS